MLFRSRLRRCIVERGVQIPENTQIGYDLDSDRARGFVVTDSNLVVVGRPEEEGGEESDTPAMLPQPEEEKVAKPSERARGR